MLALDCCIRSVGVSYFFRKEAAAAAYNSGCSSSDWLTTLAIGLLVTCSCVGEFPDTKDEGQGSRHEEGGMR